MLFSEVYNTYFNAVATIIAQTIKGDINDVTIDEIIRSKAFSESMLSIHPAIKSEEWFLLNSALETPIHKIPTMPLTDLEKRWLKTLLQDPRIKLFDPSIKGLNNIEPLYDLSDIIYYDRYNNGDPYESQKYIVLFQRALAALREKKRLFIRFTGSKGKSVYGEYVPVQFEFSPKDDKFRLIAVQRGKAITINVSRITECKLLDSYDTTEMEHKERPMMKLVLDLVDRRNALERFLLHFSNYKKETVRTSDNMYRITIWVDTEDESEMLIRILSFGPQVKILSPKNFVYKIEDRLKRQRQFSL